MKVMEKNNRNPCAIPTNGNYLGIIIKRSDSCTTNKFI